MGAVGKIVADHSNRVTGTGEMPGDDIREKARWMEVNGRLHRGREIVREVSEITSLPGRELQQADHYIPEAKRL